MVLGSMVEVMSVYARDNQGVGSVRAGRAMGAEDTREAQKKARAQEGGGAGALRGDAL